MYSTKGTEETVFESKYIEPGVQEVMIAEVKGEAPEGKSPYIEMVFQNAESKTANIRFYMSEAAMPKSLEKIKHIGTKILTEAVLDAISGDDLPSYGNALNTAFKGKKLRIKFTGEEVEGENGNWWKAVIGLPTFAEATDEGAEYDVVEEADSKLRLDKTNKWDWKQLPTTDVETASVNGSVEASNDPVF